MLFSLFSTLRNSVSIFLLFSKNCIEFISYLLAIFLFHKALNVRSFLCHRLNIQLTTKRIAWDDQSMSLGAPLMSSLTSTWSPRVTDCLRWSIGRTTSISGFRAGHDSDMNSSGRLSRLNNNDSVTISVPIIHDSLQPCEIFHDYETNNKSTILYLEYLPGDYCVIALQKLNSCKAATP